MKAHWFPILLFVIVGMVVIREAISAAHTSREKDKAFAAYLAAQPVDTVWSGRPHDQIPDYTDSGKLIKYGYELIAHTAGYLGPKGSIARLTNGMNCQNCHLDGGTIPFGNNFGKVYATYPQFRARSNSMQTIYARISDCFERSLNGTAPDTNSREMQAIYAYLQWLGKDVPKGVKRDGTGIMKLPYLNRAALPENGKIVYMQRCQQCHGANGQGQLQPGGNGYAYPPLWGPHSYNDGAGMYRLSNFAGFVKNNMPFGANYHNPQLTDEEAWDLAAYVNSQPRPHKDQRKDWENLQQHLFNTDTPPPKPYAYSLRAKRCSARVVYRSVLSENAASPGRYGSDTCCRKRGSYLHCRAAESSPAPAGGPRLHGFPGKRKSKGDIQEIWV